MEDKSSTVPAVRTHGHSDFFFERHLIYDHVLDPAFATPREQFEALSRSIRDYLSRKWVRTRQHFDRVNPKRVYYLSMEFLIGRSLAQNVQNLLAGPLVEEAMRHAGLDWRKLAEEEPDGGLGNGGLGRLAACFLDSLATLGIPAMGYGLRYDYGIFKQSMEDGWQLETPDNWLRRPDPWEVTRLNHSVEVKVHSWVTFRDGDLALTPGQGATLLGIPHDRPVVGYGGNHVNTLRLWAAGVPQSFNFGEFSSGDYISAVHQKVAAETLTRVLYPDDSNQHGLGLRFVQEYFLVACSLADIIRRFRLLNSDWKTLPDKVAIQLNDTHPALAVAELMRILLDEAKLTWGDAWDLTVRTLSYTNHTLLPEALEKWPIHYFEFILPRHLEIIYEINRRFLEEVRTRHPGDVARLERVSLIEEGGVKKVRMAHLAVVGSHSTNGVAEIHSKLLREQLLADFVDHFPTRFNNKTNGIAHRRWLLLANPELSRCITEAVGDGWILAAEELRKVLPLAEDPSFQLAFRKAKMAAKVRMTDWAKETLGVVLDPETVFDCQVKRIHEYKRQLLNLLHVGVLVDRIRREAGATGPGACPRTFIFAGKAAPAYTFAKHVIKLIHCVSAAIEADPRLRGKLRVVFLPDYGVTMAERLIPAADVSEQISTAGYEASGTSNMKLMMNGALTMGTRDGATIEMARAAGEQNFFLFGLDAEQVAATRSWYKPSWHYDNEPETHAAVDWLFSSEVVGKEPTVAVPLRDALFGRGDQFMHLADLKAYAAAQAKLAALREKPEAWSRMAIVNVASSGKFSSDRSIAEYAKEIWGAKPCCVE